MARLGDASRYELDVRGFLVLRGVLTGPEVDRLRGEVAALGLPRPDHDIWSQRVDDLLTKGPAMLELLDHPVALAALDALIGRYVRVDHTYAIRMSPGTAGLGLHGGATPFDPAQYYLHRDGVVRCGLVALSWALVDHPAGSGGFGCIPGSHRAGLPVPADVDHLVEEVPVAAGDLLVFTEAIAHRTIDWRGPGEREVLMYKYSPGSSSWGDPDRLRPAAARADLTERQRRLLQRPSVGHFQPVW